MAGLSRCLVSCTIVVKYTEIDRCRNAERALEAAGSSLEQASLDEMEALWQRAKAAE